MNCISQRSDPFFVLFSDPEYERTLAAFQTAKGSDKNFHSALYRKRRKKKISTLEAQRDTLKLEMDDLKSKCRTNTIEMVPLALDRHR